MFADTMTLNLRSLINDLDTLGVAAKHTREIKAITTHLDAYNDLEALHLDAQTFTVPAPEADGIVKRLATGDTVTEQELIDHAVKVSASAAEVTKTAQRLVTKAMQLRARAGRDEARKSLTAFVTDLAEIVDGAGTEPSRSMLNQVANTLRTIDELSGNGLPRSSKHDYWCIRNDRTGTWAVLEHSAAERVIESNEAWATEQKAQAQAEKESRARRAVPSRKPSRLRRGPIAGGTVSSGIPLTQGDVDLYKEAKTSGALTR